ncbi:Hypothetical protein D9617_2g052800 [Elsinoe fawcettii]|nr:Hypothetical protein D9617_2g052800 [Elsinoe fawcettii]
MNSVLPSYPPITTHRSTPLSPSAAQKRLERFVSSLPTAPHHHPDALITPSGVTFHPASGPNGNLQITNLRRILAGLRGENLSLSPDDLLALELLARKGARGQGDGDGAAGFDGEVLRRRLGGGVGLSGIGPSRDRGVRSDGTPVRGVLKKRKSGEVDGSQESVSADALARRDGRRESDIEMEEEGMDMEEWNERQQEVEGEVGERSMPVVREGGEEPVVREMGEEREGKAMGGLTKADKERRKAEKKKRKKDLQRQNNGMRVKKEAVVKDSE